MQKIKGEHIIQSKLLPLVVVAETVLHFLFLLSAGLLWSPFHLHVSSIHQQLWPMSGKKGGSGKKTFNGHLFQKETKVVGYIIVLSNTSCFHCKCWNPGVVS